VSLPLEQTRAGDAGHVQPEEFRTVIGHFATGVTVVTTATADEMLGTTASAVCSVSLEPPTVLVCMNESSVTGQAIRETRAFAVNILAEEQAALATRCASKAPGKLVDGEVARGPSGQPVLPGSLASLECRVTQEVRAGTHVVFFGEVQSAVANPGSPLAYYRGRFGRLLTDAPESPEGAES
jgi:flavin reductase (DIM6/NTAB) family NADH-FMN oxidoreductase RutF